MWSFFKQNNKSNNKGRFGYRLLLKTKNKKYCNKIIFKCMNSAVRPSLKVVFAEKVFTGSMNSARD